MIIQCQSLQKFHGAQQVLADVTFEVPEGARIGIVGRNGCGKSTLLSLLTGAERPDGGTVSIRRGSELGMLAQIQDAAATETLWQVLERSFAETLGWRDELRELEAQMSDPEAAGGVERLSRLLRRYGELQEKFEAAGGYGIDAEIRRVSAGLGIGGDALERDFLSLSGGEKTKAGLAALLLRRPDILLLDEPTNHLDMGAAEWLESFLKEYPGTVLAVSHDRAFLDAVVTGIVELEDGEAFPYPTDFTGYRIEKEKRLLQQFAEYQEQRKLIKKMQETIKRLREWGNQADNPKFHRRANSMQKALDRMDKIKRPVLERKSMDLELAQRDRSAGRTVVLENVRKAFGGRVLFDGLDALLRYGERTALIGGNGAGKSTLLRLILGHEQADSGSCLVGPRTEIGYLAQEALPEDGRQTLLAYFKEQAGMEEGEARGRLARFLFFGADVFKTVGSLSGGEWTRLRFAVLMERKPNLLILDEPTNHLDIDSREALEEALEEFPGTVLAVSHDRYFINRLFQKLWTLENGHFAVFEGHYDAYKEKRSALAARLPEPVKDTPTPASSGSRPKSCPAPSSGTVELEQTIAETETALGKLEAKMLEPETAADADRLLALQLEREALESRLEGLYADWVAAEA